MDIKPGGSSAASLSPDTAQADPSQPTSIVDEYLAAPPTVKSQARKAIGATSDDEAIQILQADGNAASIVRSILQQDQSVLAQGSATTPIEDVMYPPKA